VTFARKIVVGEGESARSEKIENIKISRGEESVFIWCFFLAIIETTLDPDTNASRRSLWRHVNNESMLSSPRFRGVAPFYPLTAANIHSITMSI
jgi:hypothetical protein